MITAAFVRYPCGQCADNEELKRNAFKLKYTKIYRDQGNETDLLEKQFLMINCLNLMKYSKRSCINDMQTVQMSKF